MPTNNIVNKQRSYQTKVDIWDAAFGLQQVDYLTPSEYAVDLARQNIEGKISHVEIENNLNNYHQNNADPDTREADIVAIKIAQLLSSNTFRYSPATLLSIHKHLFEGVLDKHIPTGRFRHYNITKKEPVLNNDTVIYADFMMIKETLNYDFTHERKFDYGSLNNRDKAFKAMRFISDLWQTHPFGEGNTRTMAVFAIKYFRSLGLDTKIGVFKENARFFRDALVLANYHKAAKTMEYLDKFTENLLLDGKHEPLAIQSA